MTGAVRAGATAFPTRWPSPCHPSAGKTRTRLSGASSRGCRGSSSVVEEFAVERGAVVFLAEFFQLRVAFFDEAFGLAWLDVIQGVRGNQWQRDSRVDVTHNGVGKLLWIDFAPTDRFGRGGTAEAAGVGTGVGDLEEVVVPFFAEAKHFLNLWLGLQHEVLRRTPAEDEDAGSEAVLFGIVNDGCGLVDVAIDVELHFVAAQRQ